MSEKNICQNPKCCNHDTKDRWNKKLEIYQSRKAYFKPNHKTSYGYSDTLLEYFCTTGCAFEWLRDNLESIIDHRGTVEKILEKKIRA
jgi:hypothetical protein